MRAVTAIFAAATVLSACLLFVVQPLIAKIILPWFGGSAAVWSAALVFFQGCVLGGYAYAHWLTTRCAPRVQGVVHSALLLIACLTLPIIPGEEWRPAPDGDPTLQILALLAANVGLPSLLLCATSPLLQVWYMRRTASAPPYWLFAWSNAGSLAALLSFPLLLEPRFGMRALALGWSALFILFATLAVCLAWFDRTAPAAATPTTTRDQHAPSIEQMLLWVLLAALAAGLLVSVSAHLSTNVAPIPLLWVLPLALYLLTFILSFTSARFYNRTRMFPWLALALGAMAYLYIHADSNFHIGFVIPIYLVSLFICCLACHGELAARKPEGPHLTRFYLLLALGGALGGVFVGLLAPKMFDTYLELPLLLIYIAALNAVFQWRRRGSRATLWPVRFAILAGLAVLTGSLLFAEITTREQNLLVTRNFYGVLRVRDYTTVAQLANRDLVHGTISHGSQFLNESRRYQPSSYFSFNSGAGRALRALQANGPIRYGVIGLGVGVLSSYARPGDSLRIYEINPAVARIAEEHFTFLQHARDVGADVQVLLGDARLVLEREPPQRFDLLVVDAFSSDAIPAHLLTNEAFEVYFRHLQPEGVLAVHISNRYLDLRPVTARAAEHVGRSAAVLWNPSDGVNSASLWVLITSNQELLRAAPFSGAKLYPAQAPPAFPAWTDNYSSVWRILRTDDGGDAS